MARVYLIEAVRGVAISLCIGLVIAFTAIACDISRQTRLEAHSVKGIRAPVLSGVSANN